MTGTFSNTYYLMRHGESEANVMGIINSCPLSGSAAFGLTDLGRLQAEGFAGDLERELGSGAEDVAIISSDFLRARETAELAMRVLGARTPLRIDERLRERSFGALEGKSHTEYDGIWEADGRDPASARLGVEPIVSVVSRTRALIESLESSAEGETYLLVSHGDTLLALESYLAGLDPANYRQIARLENGQIRRATQPT